MIETSAAPSSSTTPCRRRVTFACEDNDNVLDAIKKTTRIASTRCCRQQQQSQGHQRPPRSMLCDGANSRCETASSPNDWCYSKPCFDKGYAGYSTNERQPDPSTPPKPSRRSVHFGTTQVVIFSPLDRPIDMYIPQPKRSRWSSDTTGTTKSKIDTTSKASSAGSLDSSPQRPRRQNSFQLHNLPILPSLAPPTIAQPHNRQSK